MTPEGMVIRQSRFGVAETIERLAAAVADHGMAIVARIDHEAAAAAAGLTLNPTTVLIFGNAKAGTPLMQAAPTMAIDLPLRALVWRDAEGRVSVGYNDPSWLAKRHGVALETAANLPAMIKALAAITTAASGVDG